MHTTIFPSKISGQIKIPPSKSAMQRACALALLHFGETTIHRPGQSNDDKAAIEIIQSLGATTEWLDGSLIVKSNGKIRSSKDINCGESGLSFRMFAPIAALSNLPVLFKGTGSLLNRSMHFLEEFLPLLNVSVNSNNGYLPVEITGPLVPRSIVIDGSASSQYLTGLLFAYANSSCPGETITVKNLISRPYIDLTLEMLKHFGHVVNHEDYQFFSFEPVPERPKFISYHTEGDWSSAAFLLVAGAIAGSTTISGLKQDSVQGDHAILKILKNCNCEVNTDDHAISVRSGPLSAFRFDATHCPDLFPPLVALAANCQGISLITGVSRLYGKESNRAETLIDVFSKMGLPVRLDGNTMVIQGGTKLSGAAVSSHQDHRIAMAGAVAALNAEGPVIISNSEAVNKSYPSFYEDLKTLGAHIISSG